MKKKDKIKELEDEVRKLTLEVASMTWLLNVQVDKNKPQPHNPYEPTSYPNITQPWITYGLEPNTVGNWKDNTIGS